MALGYAPRKLTIIVSLKNLAAAIQIEVCKM